MSSQAGVIALPGEPIYCMTKAAINHLTRCLAVEWGPHGINVNAVAPTFIETDGTRAALSEPELRTRHPGEHRARPRRPADGGGGRGRVPRLARRVDDHRRDAPGRWRLVGEVVPNRPR